MPSATLPTFTRLHLCSADIIESIAHMYSRPAGVSELHAVLALSLRDAVYPSQTHLLTNEDDGDAASDGTRTLNVPHPLVRRLGRMSVEELAHVDVQAKLFILESDVALINPSIIGDALDGLCKVLPVQSIESLILALPALIYDPVADKVATLDGTPYTGSALPKPVTMRRRSVSTVACDVLDQAWPLWQTMEQLHRQGRVNTLGIAELTLRSLRYLVERAETPPAVNQIRVSECCALPRDLIDYGHAHGVESISHSDPRELLRTGELEEIFDQAGVPLPPDCLPLRPKWVIKFSVLAKNRGVVLQKGYLVEALAA